jgi:polysaccharide biosynthesis/export protein
MKRLTCTAALASTLIVCIGIGVAPAGAQDAQAPSVAPAAVTAPNYILGPDDVLSIKALDAEEISGTGIRIDPSGNISLPLLGRLVAGGLTVEQLERELANRLKTYVRDPVVAVTITDYRSQPVTVIGSVSQAGVHQLEGRKTLIEILAKVGGLKPDAGITVKITRRAEWGPIPLPSAVTDPTGRFSTAEVKLKGLLQATSPEDNILILPHDVISVPRGQIVYVIGEVKNPGGLVLNERATLSTVQALAMADGFTTTARPANAMVLRPTPDGTHVQIAADLSQILTGKKPDIVLLPEDILFVPNNVANTAVGRFVQAAISSTTAVAVRRVLW